MREPVAFFVVGKPQPAGSKRAFSVKKGGLFTGRTIVTDANPNSRDWKTDVRREAERSFHGEPFDGPVAMRLLFGILRPRSHYRTGTNAHLLRHNAPDFPSSRPDATKLCRGVEDALTGLLWRDDAQIVTQYVAKRYSERQGVRIELRECARGPKTVAAPETAEADSSRAPLTGSAKCEMETMMRSGLCGRPAFWIWRGTKVCERCVLPIAVCGGELTELSQNAAIPYNVEWDDNDAAVRVRGWLFIYAMHEELEAL